MVETQCTVEVDLALKVRVVEDLHGNFFLSVIEGLEFIVLDGDVPLDILARQNELLVLAFPVHGCHRPVGDYDRDTKHNDEEDIGLETAAVDDGENALDDKGHAEDEDGEGCVEFPSARLTRGAFLMAGVSRCRVCDCSMCLFFTTLRGPNQKFQLSILFGPWITAWSLLKPRGWKLNCRVGTFQLYWLAYC